MVTESRNLLSVCWLLGCERPGKAGRVVYAERGGEVPLTLCDEHGRTVRAALADRQLRHGVLVTSHDPPRVIIEEPRRPHTGRYRATFVSAESRWPTLVLRRSLHSRRGREYLPRQPDLFTTPYDEGVRYTMLEVSPEEEADEDEPTILWPKAVVVERVLGGYTDRQYYLYRWADPWSGYSWFPAA
jgi:hypothetical protein